MFNTILSMFRQIVTRLSGDPQPEPPSVRSSSVQRVMRERLSNAPEKPVSSEDQLIADAARNAPPSPGRIVSRGNNKNVYAIGDADTDDNSVLRAADDADSKAPELDTGSLETVEESGFDPYNSGVYHRPESWRHKR